MMKVYDSDRKIIYPIDPWKVRETHLDAAHSYRNETIFSVGNGYMGMRGTFEEGFGGGADATFNATYINGFYENYDIEYPEGGYGLARRGQAMVNVADGKIIKPIIDGEELDLSRGKTYFYERTLDMRKGTVERKVVWESPGGKLVEFKVKRLVSFRRHHLAAISFEVKPLNFDGRLKFISHINGNISEKELGKDMRVGSDLRGRVLRTIWTSADNTLLILSQKTKKSKFTLYCAAEHDFYPEGDATFAVETDDDAVKLEMDTFARQGKSYTVVKYLSYFTNRDVDNYDDTELFRMAVSQVREAKSDGIKVIETEQEKYLCDFWDDADVVIEGYPAAQQAIRFCTFSLLQSAGRDHKTNIAAKGLTGQGYGGHYFWDTDIYMMPFFLFTRPAMAKNMLLYRYHILDAARSRAQELGHEGALYPWRTIDGPECSAFFPAGTAQYHINADIAFAVKRYVEVTDDKEFLLKYGAEILFETARFWISLGNYVPLKDNKFCINCVTGPDEYTALVDNNAYTNYMARENLQYAVQVSEMMETLRPDDFKMLKEKIGLSRQEVLAWKAAAEHMYLPFSEEIGIIPQDDTFLYKKKIDLKKVPDDRFPLLLHWHYLNIYRHQVCKQPDVLLLMTLLDGMFTVEEVKKNFDYYEPLTTHDSSLSPSVFSILAAKIGYQDMAYDYFVQSVRMDLDDYNGNVQDGIHAAGMGGAYSAVVSGFGGMSIRDGRLSFMPRLPENLTTLSFKVRFRGRQIEVNIFKGGTRFRLLSGNAIKIKCFDREIDLDENCEVKLEKDLEKVDKNA